MTIIDAIDESEIYDTVDLKNIHPGCCIRLCDIQYTYP